MNGDNQQPQNQFVNADTIVPQSQEQVPGGKVGRFRASMIITKESWNLLKKDKEMMLFPILSSIVSIILIGLAGAALFLGILSGNIENIEKMENTTYGLEFLVAFVMYFVTVFATIFFQTGIITIVRGRLNNQDLTFGDGMKSAFSKIGKIATWSLVAATVGVILKSISERSQILGKIMVSILGAAWSILTFFIAPILIAEDLPMKESLKKSASIIKRVWGETVIVNVGVSLFFGMLSLLGMIIFIALLFTMNTAIIIGGAVLLLLYLILLSIISSTLSVIFKVVLYEYANTGNVPNGFSEDVIGLAFKEQKKKGIIGIGGI